MDEKDPKDDELNPQGQDNINDADDSFGLPDIDFKRLDDDTQEEASGDSSQYEESIESHSLENTPYEKVEDKRPAFQYLDGEESKAPKIISGLIILLIVAATIWFFQIYRPQQQKIAEEAIVKQEQIDKQKADAKLKLEQEAAAAANEAQRLRDEAEATAKAGVVILNERTNRYFIVLESFVDEDFAKDFGNRIAKSGTPAWLIPPYSRKKLQRVGIGGYESLDEANAELNNVSDQFGEGKWILKY